MCEAPAAARAYLECSLLCGRAAAGRDDTAALRQNENCFAPFGVARLNGPLVLTLRRVHLFARPFSFAATALVVGNGLRRHLNP